MRQKSKLFGKACVFLFLSFIDLQIFLMRFSFIQKQNLEKLILFSESFAAERDVSSWRLVAFTNLYGKYPP